MSTSGLGWNSTDRTKPTWIGEVVCTHFLGLFSHQFWPLSSLSRTTVCMTSHPALRRDNEEWRIASERIAPRMAHGRLRHINDQIQRLDTVCDCGGRPRPQIQGRAILRAELFPVIQSWDSISRYPTSGNPHVTLQCLPCVLPRIPSNAICRALLDSVRLEDWRWAKLMQVHEDRPCSRFLLYCTA